MASNFSIKLSVSESNLIASIKDAINAINSGDKLKNSPVNVYANEKTLTKSINDAIKTANDKFAQSENGKIKVTVNSKTLINSINSSIGKFNRQAGTEGKTVKLTAELDITASLKKLQSQLAKNNITSVNVGSDNTAKAAANAVINDNSSNTASKNSTSEKAAETAATNALTSAIRDEARAYNELGTAATNAANAEKQRKTETNSLVSSVKEKAQAEKEYVQLTLDNYTEAIEDEKRREAAAKSTTAVINEQNKAIAEGNELLRRRTNYTDELQQTPVTRATTTGNSYRNTTYYDMFNNEEQRWVTVSSTVAENFEKLNKENAKTYDTLSKLGVELDKIKAKMTGALGSKGIDETSEAFKRLEAEGVNIEKMFTKIIEASGTVRDNLISDAETAIKKYDLSVKQAQNEQYAATSLRTKDVPTIKAIEINKLDTLRAQLTSTHIPASVLTEDFQRLTAELNNVSDQNSLVGYLNNLDIFKSKAESFSTIFKQIDESIGKLNSANGVINSSGFSGILGEDAVSGFNVQITELTDKLNTLKTALTNAKSPETMQENINAYAQMEKEVTELSNAISQLNSLSSGANKDINKLSSILNPAIFKQNNQNENVVRIKEQVTELDAEYRKFLTDLAKDVSPEGLKKSEQTLNELQSKFTDLRTAVASVKNDLQQTNIDNSFLKQQQSLIADIEDYMRKNSYAMNKIDPSSGLTYSEVFTNIEKSAQAAADGGAIKQLANQVSILKSQIQAAGQEGATFFSEMASKAAKFIKWTGMTLLITKVRMYFRKLFTTVYDLDTALIDLKKTFTGTNEELNQFYYEANDLAKQLGVTTEEIIEQGSAWSRLGYSTKEAMETMAEMSSMLASISPDMDTEEATDGLVSIMKAFDIDTNDVLDGVLSKINIVGNTAATTNGEIVEMLEKSSSAMKEANNTLDETIALETAAVEITRDASSVGNAFKTVSMRIRGYDEETEEYIGNVEELSGEIADLTKTAKTPGGISLFTDENKTTYKSTYQLLKEISEIYDDLTDKQQAGLLEALAGKRQGQIVAATITNFEAAEKALDSMANSAGNAEAEMDVIRESAEYALNELKETFTELSQNAVSRGELKSLINAGTTLLSILNSIVEKIGAIPTLLGTIFGIIATKSKTLFSFNKNTGNFSLFGTDLGKGWFSNIKANITEVQAIARVTNEMRSASDGAAISVGTMNKVMATSNTELKNLVTAYNRGFISTNEFKAGLQKMSTGLTSANGAVTALKTGLASLAATAASIAVSMAISWAIGKLITAITEASNKVEKLTDSAKENIDAAKEAKSELESLNSELSTTKKRLTELEKIKLTRGLNLFEQDEYDELKKYNDQLERQIRLETAKMELELQEANNDAKKAISKAELDWGTIVAGSKITQRWGVKGSDLPSSLKGFSGIDNFKTESEAQLAAYEDMLKKYEELQDEQSKLSGKELEKKTKEVQEFKERLDSLESSLMNNMSSVYQWQLSLDPDDPANKENLEYLENLIHQYEVLTGSAATTFSELWEKGEYGAVREELENLAKAGELTADKFDALNDTDISGIEAFKEELEQLGYTDTDEIIRSIIMSVEDLDESENSAAKTTNGLTQAFDELYETVDDLIDKQEKLADTFKKIQLGTKLTAQEVYELVKEMPELAKYVEKTANGFTITEEGVRAVAAQNEKETKNQVKTDLEEIRQQISLLENLEELKAKRDEAEAGLDGSLRAFNTFDDIDTEYQQAVTECQDITQSLEELRTEEEQLVVVQNLLYDLFDGLVAVENYDDAKSAISDFNDEIRTLNDAAKKINANELLSYDEMVEIVEIAPELQDFFTEMQDGYDISADKITEWSEKCLEARNEYIQGLIDQANAELETARNSKLASETILNALTRLGVSTEEELENARADIDAADKEIEDLLDLIEKYQALQGNLLDAEDNSENNLSDELQNRIDHYKTIIEAVSAVRDKYAESLDEEIDALNDSKDALKDANDERQRELDLIEARNNLENAKKRKVYVYSEGEGFKQVQDESAVKEAEEAYRDAITEIQEAEIDKAIDEREKQKEALDDAIKDLTEAEENIQNALIIKQAMEEYGLTDASELLTLSDDIKQGIIEGLAESTLQKDIEDNKENSEYTAVTLDSLLQELGSEKNASDIDSSIFDNITQAAYNNAVQEFADALKSSAENMVNNVSYNNSPTINANFVINNADDPQAVADTVNEEIGNFLRQYCDSIK